MATTTLTALEQSLDELNHFLDPLPPAYKSRLIEDYFIDIGSGCGVRNSRLALRRLTQSYALLASHFDNGVEAFLDGLMGEEMASRISDEPPFENRGRATPPYSPTDPTPFKASAAVL
jgi:hypothetical protein